MAFISPTPEEFEGTLAAYTLTGSPTLTSGAAIFGSQGLHIAGTNAATYIDKSLPASTRMVVGVIYFKCSAAPSATNGLFVCTGNSGMRINIRSDGKLGAQAVTGTQQTTAGTYMDGLPHYIDFRFDRSGATATIDWKVDGVAQTQATFVTAAADMSTWRTGYDGTTGTFNHDIDHIVLTDNSADYPIGPVVSAKHNPMGMMGFFGQ